MTTLPSFYYQAILQCYAVAHLDLDLDLDLKFHFDSFTPRNSPQIAGSLLWAPPSLLKELAQLSRETNPSMRLCQYSIVFFFSFFFFLLRHPVTSRVEAHQASMKGVCLIRDDAHDDNGHDAWLRA